MFSEIQTLKKTLHAIAKEAKIYILVHGDSPYRICKVVEVLLNDPEKYEFIFFPISGVNSLNISEPMVEYIDKKCEIIIYDKKFAGHTERFFNNTLKMLGFTNFKFIEMGFFTGVIHGMVEAINGHRCQPRYVDATKDIPPIDNTIGKCVIFYLYYYSLEKNASIKNERPPC